MVSKISPDVQVKEILFENIRLAASESAIESAWERAVAGYTHMQTSRGASRVSSEIVA